ncbi:MAG: beta-lactamase family protein, partial [Acidobacteriota bacterium]|nr:beta-lactamase family protein [Acidobacteriota bacterium]
ALCLDAGGRLPLSTPVGEIWVRCEPKLARRTLEDLLRHRSGLRPWTPLYLRCHRRQEVERLLLDGELLGASAGTYSDLGYILWGLAAERVLGRTPDELLREFLLEPLGEDGLRTTPVEAADAMRCELDTRREVELASAEGLELEPLSPPRSGSVQDGNTRFLGGYTGHAGLFSTPEALWRLVQEWLSPGGLLSAAAVRRALTGGRTFACGWERRRVKKSAGPALSRGSFGHIGFTGGSCWVDPQRDRVFVLLAHRTRELPNLDRWRRRFHGLEF